jgi:3-phosphoshikimate 1-carboxyvinyltransferase
MYPIVAALLTPGSEVTVTGIDPDDPQPDRLVLDVLREMGGDIEVGPDRVTARSSTLAGRRIDCNDFIDQFMLLAVAGAAAEGETELVNAEIARHKECDRVAEMARALSAMGAEVRERPDGLLIRRSALRGAELDSRADHRMVMTLSVAGLIADGATTIRDAQCVEKTFAAYPQAMAALGARFQTR